MLAKLPTGQTAFAFFMPCKIRHISPHSVRVFRGQSRFTAAPAPFGLFDQPNTGLDDELVLTCPVDPLPNDAMGHGSWDGTLPTLLESQDRTAPEGSACTVLHRTAPHRTAPHQNATGKLVSRTSQSTPPEADTSKTRDIAGRIDKVDLNDGRQKSSTRRKPQRKAQAEAPCSLVRSASLANVSLGLGSGPGRIVPDPYRVQERGTRVHDTSRGARRSTEYTLSMENATLQPSSLAATWMAERNIN
ncbi:hypothetical protein CPLU01_05258 [Colletotrichum plurivorum]|uniref:Uncharacterized protein n=1 Tax=Colletotrichum plurivorum TaxID=2175906 RepID=A0A8H6KN45_9PEZI|nr:hypothetical protein CPLU01_05258 [Colletotrichum plurivorum]